MTVDVIISPESCTDCIIAVTCSRLQKKTQSTQEYGGMIGGVGGWGGFGGMGCTILPDHFLFSHEYFTVDGTIQLESCIVCIIAST